MPSSFLARKVLVCEGATEVGICRRLAERWMQEYDEVPIEHFGVEIADGGGSSAPYAAMALADLKYAVAYLGDSDKAKSSDVAEMQVKGIKVMTWEGKVCTEERIALDLPDKGLAELLKPACAARGRDSIGTVISDLLGVAKPADPSKLESWTALGVSDANFRAAFGQGAKGTEDRKGWFKSVDGGYALGRIIVNHLDDLKDSSLSARLKETEAWCYDGAAS